MGPIQYLAPSHQDNIASSSYQSWWQEELPMKLTVVYKQEEPEVLVINSWIDEHSSMPDMFDSRKSSLTFQSFMFDLLFWLFNGSDPFLRRIHFQFIADSLLCLDM